MKTVDNTHDSTNNKRAALHNLGCKVNACETEAMQRLLEAAGYAIVPFSEQADVYVINTCSVTNIADRKSRQMIHRAKKKNPAAVIVAAGCYAQTKGVGENADPAVDIWIGNNQKGRLAELLEAHLAARALQAEEESIQPDACRLAAVLDINAGPQPFEELGSVLPAEHSRAFLKVQDGCNQFCSYCIIPYARGRVRSRPMESVLAEVRHLAANAYREVVLTGIHLSSYGADCGESLLHVIQEIHAVDGIWRIRLGSLEPKIVTEPFVQALAKLPKICPHFHLSLQSGCDSVLSRMNRKYTAKEYEEGCALLRKYFKHPAITTDVIVGFPGETEEEFLQTVEFARRIRFYEMHIFKYSRRQGTRAAAMDGQIEEHIKADRSAVLFALAEQMSAEFRAYYSGKEVQVLFEEALDIDGKTMYAGYTPEYVRIACSSDRPLENEVVCGRVTGCLKGDIYGMDPVRT